MFKRSLVFLLGCLTLTLAHAEIPMERVQKLRNDKEVGIRAFGVLEKAAIKKRYFDENFKQRLDAVFYKSMHQFVNNYNWKCELGFIGLLRKNLQEENFKADEKSLVEYYKVLRVNQSIDDILYAMLDSVTKDYFGLNELNLVKRADLLSFKRKKLLKANNLEELFENFDTWPDEKQLCTYQEYVAITGSFKGKDGKKSNNKNYLEALIQKAYEKGIIPKSSYHGLNYLLRKGAVNDRHIWMEEYLNIIFNAKNQMVPKNREYKVIDLDDENRFASEKVSRFRRITRREKLYRKYNETQIILLSQVLQKASKRMGADPDTITKAPVISQEFTVVNDDGEQVTTTETITLDPQSQYNLARRLMRKDISDLQMMAIFAGQKITYEDVVMAGFETGYVGVEEIEFVVKYDDLWNPEVNKQEKMIGFVTTIVGYATFLLPPPWNVVASIALGLVEGLVMGQFKNGAENDNPSTFIE